jgi:hypothetical protein
MCYVIVETKLEVGSTNTDPLLQAACYNISNMRDKVVDEKIYVFSNFPCFQLYVTSTFLHLTLGTDSNFTVQEPVWGLQALPGPTVLTYKFFPPYTTVLSHD